MLGRSEEAAVEQLSDPQFKRLVLASILPPVLQNLQQCTDAAADAPVEAAAAAARHSVRKGKEIEPAPADGVRP